MTTKKICDTCAGLKHAEFWKVRCRCRSNVAALRWAGFEPATWHMEHDTE